MRWLNVVLWIGIAAAVVTLPRFAPSEAPTLEQLLADEDVAEIERIRALFGREADTLLVADSRSTIPASRIQSALAAVEGVSSTAVLSEHSVIALLEPGTLQLSRSRELMDRVDAALRELPGPVAVVGAPRMRVESWRMAADDLRRSWYLLAAAVLVIPALCFGSLGAALFPLTLALLTTATTLAAYRWFTGPLNALSMLLVPIVWSVATLDAVHLYDAVRRAGAGAWARLWAPCLVTTLTTAGGFGALAMQGESQLIRSFGIWAAFGTGVAFILTFTLGRSILGASGSRRPLAKWPRRVMTGIVMVSERHARAVLTLWLVLVVGAAFFASRVQIDVRFPHIFTADHPVARDLKAIEALLDTDLAALDIYIEATDDRGRDEGELAKAVGLVSHQASTIEECRVTLPLDILRVRPAAPPRIVEDWRTDPRLAPWVRFDAGAARVQVHFARMSLQRRREVQDWLRHFDRTMLDHHRVSFGGPGYYYPIAEERGFAGTIKGGLLSLLVMAVVLRLTLRGGVTWLAAMIGNLVPLLMVVGLMGALQIPWSLALVPLPAVLFGLAVDDTVHLLWRGGRVRAGAWRSGAPLLATTLMLAACVGTLAFSGLLLNRELGVLLASAMLLALACDTSLLPVLVRLSSSRRSAR